MRRRYFWLAAALAVSFFTYRYVASWDAHHRIVFLDVGQGDAVLIRTRTGETTLIDGGPDDRAAYGLGQHLPFWQREIDYVVLSHPHADHVTGLPEVLRRYRTGTLLYNRIGYGSPQNRAWLAAGRGIEARPVVAGDVLAFGGIAAEALWPTDEFLREETININELSNVWRFEIGGVSLLSSGDAEATVERELLALGTDLAADIFKVAHHGSPDSNDEDFLDAVDPELAVVQVGAENRFGHPSPRVLRRLERVGAEVRRTDRDGAVTVLVRDGEWDILQ